MKALTENRVEKITGFRRAPEYDFSDDGSHFTGWEYKGLPLTQHRSSKYGTYLSFRVDYISHKKGFTYEDYSNTPWYKLCYKYNGVPELPEIEEIVKDLEVVVAGVEELSKRVESEEVNSAPIIQRAGIEIQILESFTKKFESEFKFWACKNEYELKRAYDYYRGVQRHLENVKSWYKDPDSKENLRDMAQRVAKYGYIEIKGEDDFYMRELTEMLEAQKAA